MVTCYFLPAETAEITRILSSPERELKAKMFSCHASQRSMLAAFPITIERFRLAPRYDFTKPPHLGAAYYDRFEWGIHSSRWRQLAGEALSELLPEKGMRC